MGTPVRAVVVEDEDLFRDALCIALSQSGRVSIVGAYADGPAALSTVPGLAPGVALLDIALPGGINGVHLGRLLRRKSPSLGIVLLSHYRDPAVLTGVPERELAGWSYLLKSSVRDIATLLRAVEGTAAGHVVVDAGLLGPPPALASLSPRQVEILGLVAQGYSNAAIAEDLAVSRKTVENQINGIFRALTLDPDDHGVQARVQAVLAYLRATRPAPAEGLLPPPRPPA